MAKVMKYMLAVLLFLAGNLYLGNHLIRQYNEFKVMDNPVSIEIIKDAPPAYFGLIDLDKDGEDEVVHAHSYSLPGQREISILEPLEKDYLPHYYGETLVPETCLFFDAYFDDAFNGYVFKFLEYRDGFFFLRRFRNNGIELPETRWQELTEDTPALGIGFGPPILTDLEDDGKPELVIIIAAFYKKRPRGVICFNPDTGERLWIYTCGTSLNSMEFIDLEGDGKKEIVLSSTAVNNGADDNGTNDGYSYVIVLNSDGSERWHKQIDEWYSATQSTTGDLDNDGVLEIITTTRCHQKRRKDHRGKIVILDSRSGDFIASSSPAEVSFSQPVVRKTREHDRIYTGDSAGAIRMYDHHLNLIGETNVQKPVSLANAPGWDYLVAGTEDALIAYDWDLERKVLHYRFKEPDKRTVNDVSYQFFIPFRTHKGRYALVNADKLYRFSIKKVTLSKKSEILVSTGLLFTIIGLVVFNGYFGYRLYRYRHPPPLPQLESGRPDPSGFLKIIQGIAHQLKNPISTILWTSEKLRRELDKIKENKTRDSYRQLADFLAEDADTLKRQTNRMLRLVQSREPQFKKTSLKPVLRHLTEHFRATVPENIWVILEMEENINFSMDEELIKEAIVNLMDNAIDAMPEGGKLIVSAVSVPSPSKGGAGDVLIEITDTGQGMDDQQCKQLFTPFVTTKKEGSGIGLYICKQVIEAHGGAIDVHTRKDFGTNIAIILPVKSGGPGEK